MLVHEASPVSQPCLYRRETRVSRVRGFNNSFNDRAMHQWMPKSVNLIKNNNKKLKNFNVEKQHCAALVAQVFHFSRRFQRHRTKGYFCSSMGSIWFSLSHSTAAITWQARLGFVLKDTLMGAKEESTVQSNGVLFDVESPWPAGIFATCTAGLWIHTACHPTLTHTSCVQTKPLLNQVNTFSLSLPSSLYAFKHFRATAATHHLSSYLLVVYLPFL